MASRIEDYAIIGDCHSVAVVGKDGSIDWLCMPRFDSHGCFSGLLGTDEHGHWQLCPVDEYEVSRQYVGSSTVLATTCWNPSGCA